MGGNYKCIKSCFYSFSVSNKRFQWKKTLPIPEAKYKMERAVRSVKPMAWMTNTINIKSTGIAKCSNGAYRESF